MSEDENYTSLTGELLTERDVEIARESYNEWKESAEKPISFRRYLSTVFLVESNVSDEKEKQEPETIDFGVFKKVPPPKKIIVKPPYVPGEKLPTIQDLIIHNKSRIATFYQLIRQKNGPSGLFDALGDKNRAYTVFIPTDEAFGRLINPVPERNRDRALDREHWINYPKRLTGETEYTPNILSPHPKIRKALSDILKFHVMPDTLTYASLRGRNFFDTMLSSEGSRQKLLITAKQIDGEPVMFVMYAKVIQSDVRADNGVIHIIDDILIPYSVRQDLIESAAENDIDSEFAAPDTACNHEALTPKIPTIESKRTVTPVIESKRSRASVPVIKSKRSSVPVIKSKRYANKNVSDDVAPVKKSQRNNNGADPPPPQVTSKFGLSFVDQISMNEESVETKKNNNSEPSHNTGIRVRSLISYSLARIQNYLVCDGEEFGEILQNNDAFSRFMKEGNEIVDAFDAKQKIENDESRVYSLFNYGKISRMRKPDIHRFVIAVASLSRAFNEYGLDYVVKNGTKET